MIKHEKNNISLYSISIAFTWFSIIRWNKYLTKINQVTIGLDKDKTSSDFMWIYFFIINNNPMNYVNENSAKTNFIA